MRKAVCGVILSTGLLVFLLIIARSVEYLLAEHVYQTHYFRERCSDCSPSPSPRRSGIPKHIHQIFFFETESVLPDKYVKAQKTWRDNNPGFDYTLWNKTSINALIDAKYPRLRTLYDGYDHWVKRADVARYLVLHQHGGWYIDLDINCLKSIGGLTNEANRQNKSLIFRWTLPSGCSNDFIGVTPNHPFFNHVIDGLPESNRWFVSPYMTTIFSTGPMFLWGRFLNYPYKDEMLMLHNHSEYLGLMHGSSWHRWDGVVVWYFYNHVIEFWTIFVLIACVTCTLCIYCKYRRAKCRRLDLSPKIT